MNEPDYTRKIRLHWAAFAAALALLLAQGCGTESQRLEPSKLGSFSRFGRSIDMSGTRAVVGAYQEGSGQGAAYVFQRIGATWSIEARLASPNPDDEQFGDAVAISGDTIAVGAPLDDQPGAFRSGSVYVFERSAGVWTYTATLSSGAHQAHEAFGISVALDADTLVVGAVDRDQGAATDAGAAFVYERSGGSWTLLQQLAAPAPVASDKFGNAVDVAGTTLVVGAVRRNHGRLTDAGSVFVYTRARLFTLAQTLVASDAAADDVFGVSLALQAQADGSRRLVVGAENADPAGISRAGAAYVFDSAPAAAFSQTQKLVASDPTANAIFGDDVALSGDRILVGAPSATGAAAQSGAAYAFALQAGSFTQQAKLERSPSDPQAFLGSAVAQDGLYALVSANGEEIGTLLDDTGAVHAFVELSGVFTHGQVLSAAAAAVGQAFGRRMSLAGGTLVASGSAHADVFRRDAFGWSEEQHLPALPSTVVSGVAADAASLAIVGRRNAADPAVPLVYAQIFTQVGGAFTLQQQLEPDLVSAALPDESASSLVIALEGDTLAIGARRWNGGDGRVFVYERAGVAWTQSQLFVSPQQATNFDMNFGNQVRLDENTLVVAEVPSSGIPGSPQNGNVFVYTRPNATADFVQQQVLSEDPPSMGDRFGAGIAIDGDLLAVYSGANQTLHVYRRTAGTFAEIWSEIVPDVNGLFSSFEVGLALAGDRLAIGATAAAVDGVPNAGEVRLLERQADDSYALDRVFRASAPPADLGLGLAVVLDGDRLVASTSASASRLYAFEL